ncbi:exosomal 3'-to-5' phosphorolytic exoribonuclease Ski6 [Schizosaccharomyces japonicus yFS275]|uniref:Ribosomal RNA-processing protein 41 n=1 Tax=Schizosaccharomyces japonicus (strain yFS275 / FY16936) TaxID=402676 RepID=B6K3J3_SCHJY|nr:exosomal 3'-to-5' phosphorolytic exoribonuclease Ski6 [Schizosaccharomyces japonicus yFS275]EEB08050.2 exosomal 3'-to-5' phosphorolytic exoribonuclease Ski6 [Schizosaccharomyces japonicus yFS275]
MSHYEVISAEGLRQDGRRWNEMREFDCRIGVEKTAHGSSFIQHGNTRVLCNVNGPSEPYIKGKSKQEKAFINVELNFAPFSLIDRKKRHRSDKRIQEQCVAIQRTFEQAIQVELYPKSQISISLNVLEDDGGAIATCINAATLALIDAGIAMVDYVCCATAGIYETQVLLDLNTNEESDISWMTVGVLGTKGKVTYLKQETKLSLDLFEPALTTAIAGCDHIALQMQKVVRQSAKTLLSKMA